MMGELEYGPFGEEWSLEYVQEKLKNLADESVSIDSASPDGYEMAAAVLAHFDPIDLNPLIGEEAGSKEQVLTNSAVIVEEDGEPRLVLRANRRREALEGLGTDGIRAALSQNVRPNSTLQRMMDAYIIGEAPELQSQTEAQLSATLQVSEWLSGLIPGLPESSEVRRRVARESLLRPFRELAGTAFAGRRAELDILREHVGFLEARSIVERVRRGAQSLLGENERAPLVISAPGGMGKSALLARFILDHLEPGQDSREPLPFVYLDFDRASLIAERPMTLLIEAASQLATQFPQIAAPWAALQPAWLPAIQQTAIDPKLLYDFSDLVQQAGLTNSPLLFVLDTFEEVQYRSRDFVEQAFVFVNELQQVVSQLRVVVVGRAAVTLKRIATRSLVLPPLEQRDAAQYLRDRGIEDPVLASRVAEQVGGNPLSLRLALDVIQREGAEKGGLAWLQTRDRLYMRLRDSRIQGQLYRRILGHVHDPRIAKLAHPGLVLRRVTPELIRDVLAIPCGVDVSDIAEARRLFDEMHREVSLVTIAEDGSLRHLPEVRRVMLDLLRSDEPVKVQEIQERAVAYYRQQPESDVASRAELVYHMLLLSRPRAELDPLWKPELSQYLGDASEELPPNSATWLATRLGISLDLSSTQHSGLEDWERYALKRTRDVLQIGKPEVAIDILRERDERTHGSLLYLPQAQAQIMVRDLLGAQNSIATGLREVQDPAALLKLNVTNSWADRLSLDPPARDPATELHQMRKRFGDDPRIIRFGLNRLEHARGGVGSAALRATVRELAAAIPDSAFSFYPLVARELAARFGADDRWLLMRFAVSFGLTSFTTRSYAALFDALARWDRESGVFELYHVDMSPSDPSAAISNLGLLAQRVKVPAEIWVALAGCFDEFAKGRTDQMLYDEIETEQPGSSKDSRSLPEFR